MNALRPCEEDAIVAAFDTLGEGLLALQAGAPRVVSEPVLGGAVNNPAGSGCS